MSITARAPAAGGKGLAVMTEHRIRLRGGWECRQAGAPVSVARRLDLPVRWSSETVGPLVLTRRFGCPAFDCGRQILSLHMDRVAGTRAIVLNGQPIAEVAPERASYAIELGTLPGRNLLVLEVDLPPQQGGLGAGGDEWGVIALVIRERDPAVGHNPGVAGQIDLE